MFTRARLRLTLVYLALLGGTLALVVGGILYFGTRQARRSDDLQLRLAAEGVANRLLVLAPFPARVDARQDRWRPPERGMFGDPRRFLEQQGTLTYVLPVVNGRLVTETAGEGEVAGLPDAQTADAALAAGSGLYRTVSLPDGEVRVYSVPVRREGRVIAVAQSARSRYFLESTVRRLLLTVLAAGAAGLVLSGGVAFWLSGRTLRPIAAALQRQRDFTADASHELRTPLTLVRGNAELLLRHPERRIGEYEDVVQDIVAESERLTRLVGGLLTLARADDDRLRLEVRRVDLAELAAALARDYEPLAAAKGLRLTVEVSPGVSVDGDADRLREVGGILLENAIRYTALGSIALSVRAQGANALLAVRDTGPGIAAEHLPRIFERFYRVDPARSSEDGGVGLGLAIAQTIAHAHRGRLEAASVAGQGSTFTLTLPRAAAGQAPPSRDPGSDRADSAREQHTEDDQRDRGLAHHQQLRAP